MSKPIIEQKLQSLTDHDIGHSMKVILFCQLVVGVGQSILLVLMPPMARDIGIEDYLIGYIFTGSALALMLVSPFMGQLSDKNGRKIFITIGVFGYSLSVFLFAYIADLGLKGVLAATYTFVLLSITRIIYALFFAGVMPATTGYIVDIFPQSEHTKNIGKMQAAMGMGMILGPVLGIATLSYGLTMPMYISGVFGVVAFLLALTYIREPNITRDKQKMPKLKLFDKRIFSYIIIGFAFFFCLSGMQLTAGLFLQDRFSLTTETVAKYSSIMMIIAAFSMILVQIIIVGKLKISPQYLLRYGVLAGFIGILVLLFASNIYVFWLAVAIFAAGLGGVGPAFVSASVMSVSKNETGSVAGVAASAQAMAFMLAPGIMSSIYVWHIYAPFIILAILMLLLTIYVFTSKAPLLRGENPDDMSKK